MRKLTWAALSYAIAVFLMHYVLPYELFYAAIMGCICVGTISLLLLRGKMRTRLLLICLFFTLGLVRYEHQMQTKVEAVAPFVGNEYRISATITEYPTVYEDSIKYTVQLQTDLIPEVKAVLYDYTESRTPLLPGTVIRANVSFSSAVFASGEETDSYISKGLYLRCYVTDGIKTIGQDRFMVKYLPQKLGYWIRSVFENYLPERSAAFLNALLTGDKTALYDDPELNNTLTRAGIAHVVAVSGMHVSFVLGVSMLLFGNRRGWIMSIILMALFAIVTGLSPSVMRAVLMQLLFLLAPVLRRESDGITSIAFALLILLLLNPFAIASVGLQLSFLSMAGIILITPAAAEWFERKCPAIDGIPVRVYRFVTASLSASLGATILTAPACAYYFGSVAVLAPLTNLLVLWIVPYCFTGGFILCGLSLIFPHAAGLFANVLDWGVDFVYWVAKFISTSSVAAIYLPENLMLLWFVIVYGVIGIMLFFKKDGLYRPLLPITLACTLLFGMHTFTQRSGNDGLTVAAVDVGQGQCVIAMENNRTLMIDCGGRYDAGDRAARWLYSHGRERVDLLILSHFDEDHVNGVVDLMTQIPVESIVYCGNNMTESELPLLNAIKQQAERDGTELSIVNTQSDISLGSMNMGLIVSPGDDSNDGIMVSLRSGNFRMLVMGDADFDAEAFLLRSSSITDGDCIVVGHHGSKTSTGEALLERFQPEYAIISCGFNRYGHPTQEVLDRLSSRNVVIYRTDQMGSIEVKVR